MYMMQEEPNGELENKGDKIVIRMFSVSPKDEERFYLRMLLQYVRGPQSFQDIRTVDGIVHDTFKAAAVARYLVDGDQEWTKLLEDAARFKMPKQLRQSK